MAQTFRIFAEREFGELCAALRAKMKEKIYSEEPNYILNVNQTEYVSHLALEFVLDPLELHFEDMNVSSYERNIPAERFPPTFSVYPGESYPRQVICYHIPFSGDQSLLRCAPSPRILHSQTVALQNGDVSFDVVDFSGDPNRIKAQADSVIGRIKEHARYLAKNVSDYNASLTANATSMFDDRRAQLLKQNQVVAALGVPVRKPTDLSKTFAVPATVRKQVAPRPQASSEKYTPEPALDEAIYNDILQTVFDTGRVFERLPSTYAGKDEETLRDHLILNLEPRFQIGTTGETFNKSGKTDILMRYENKNVFVAECKFWRGQKVHMETIDQLLSYLTWRDSKTAIVYFVDGKEIAAPLRSIDDNTAQHPCFLKAHGKLQESWFSYEFHLPGDHSRSVHVAILCFHLPKP